MGAHRRRYWFGGRVEEFGRKWERRGQVSVEEWWDVGETLSCRQGRFVPIFSTLHCPAMPRMASSILRSGLAGRPGENNYWGVWHVCGRQGTRDKGSSLTNTDQECDSQLHARSELAITQQWPCRPLGQQATGWRDTYLYTRAWYRLWLLELFRPTLATPWPGLINATTVDQRTRDWPVGDALHCVRNPDTPLHLIPRHSAGEMWSAAPLAFTVASLLAPPKKLLALRVTADWAHDGAWRARPA